MAETPKFLAVLQAVDRITGPLDAAAAKLKSVGGSINRDFNGPVRSGVAEAAGRFGALGAHAERAGQKIAHAIHPHGFAVLTGHLRILRGHFGNLGASVGQVGQSLTSMLPMLAGLGAITSVGGLAAMMEHVADQQSVIENTAKSLGTTTHHVLALNLAAEHVDLPVTEMTRSMERFNSVLGKAGHGGNKAALSLFQHLGISLTDSHGKALKMTAILPKLMNAFKHTHDQAMRSSMAVTLFGRAGMKLLPFLDQGAEGWRRYNAESRKVDYDPTKKEREGLKKFHTSWIDLHHAVDSVETAIGAKLGPVLQPIVQQFQQWVTANREWIADKVVDAVKGLAAALKKIDIKAVVHDFGAFAKHAINIGDAIGPLPATIGAITLALGAPLLHAMVSVIRDMKELTVWAGKAAYAIGTTLIGAVKSAGTAIQGLDATFMGTTIGRAAYVAFDMYDAATHPKAMHLNAAQSSYMKGLHVPVGHALTYAQSQQLASLATPPKAGPSLDQRLSHLLGLDARPARRLGGPDHPLGSGPLISPRGSPSGGTSRLLVHFQNAPPGMRVRTAPQGGGIVPDVSVGYANPAFGY